MVPDSLIFSCGISCKIGLRDVKVGLSYITH